MLRLGIARGREHGEPSISAHFTMSRPSFLSAWAASARIYDATNPGAKVAQVIGGNVAKNINNPDPKQRWENTCAVRMSYILNYSGLLIPRAVGQTVSADKRWYYFRVPRLIAFLKQQWGQDSKNWLCPSYNCSRSASRMHTRKIRTQPVAESKLRRRGRDEAEALREILRAQIRLADQTLEKQLSFEFTDAEREQREQRERDRKHIAARRAALDVELEGEPLALQQSYEVLRRRVEPIGLVYLWPTTR